MEIKKSSVDLVEFQKRLNSNLDAQIASDDTAILVGFNSAGKNWLINLDSLREVEGVPPGNRMQKISLAKQFVLGIANFKGNIYTLVDLQLFLGDKKPTLLSINARALLFHPKFEISTALIVSELSGLISIKDLIKVDGLTPSNKWVTAAYKTADGSFWELIDINLLSASDELIEIESV